MADFASKIHRLAEIKKSIPEVVAKLERARTVLCEEGTKRIKPKITQTTLAFSNHSENLSDLINRQRRIDRQLDLAAKISQQF